MIKFVHAADLHLDSPFQSLPPEKATALRQEQRTLVEELISLCNTQQADLLLLSGDLFDSAGVFRQTVQGLQRAFAGCRAQVFIAPGNHDFVVPGSPWLREGWPENVHIFLDSAISAVDLPDLGCRVYGAAFTATNCPTLLENFRVADASLCNIMVLHGDAQQSNSPYNPISTAQIAQSGLDYLALGHIHSYSGALRAGTTTYAWPGCTMGRGFDETGEKGVICGTLDNGQCSIRFLPLAKRHYVIASVPVGDDPLQSVVAQLPANTQTDCYRILLTGEADRPDLRALRQALEPRFFSLDLRDETTPSVDLWANCGENSLEGLFLQSLQGELDKTTDDTQRRLLQQAARLGLDLLEGREVSMP